MKNAMHWRAVVAVGAVVALSSVLVVVSGCQAGGEPSLQERCDEAVANLTRCYPDLAAEGECTEETLAMYESHALDVEACDSMDNLGKADAFGFSDCTPGTHVCGYIFCCDDYVITKLPYTDDFNIVGLVDDYQALIPEGPALDFLYATREDLLDGMARTWEQDVSELPGAASLPMAVELSKLLIEVDYDQFIAQMPPQDWGVELAYYLGGEVIVYEEDELGRAVRQAERMVLSPIKIDMDLRLGNMDMTKVEVIQYEADRAKVYWRVYYSDNDSTETDVGSVEFIRHDETSTLVVFHSAHRLNAPLGIHLSNDIVQFSLQTFFLDHAENYADLFSY